jgi:hypothetical protein
VTGAHPTLPAPAPAAAAMRATTPVQCTPVRASTTQTMPAQPARTTQSMPAQTTRATTPPRGTPAHSSSSTPTLLGTPAPTLTPAKTAQAPAPSPVYLPAPTPAHLPAPSPAPVAATPVTAPIAATPAPVSTTPAHPIAGEPAWRQVAQCASNRTPTPVPVAEPYHAPADKAAHHDDDVPQLKPKSFLGGLFTRKKKPVADIAAKADKIEFTDRMPKLPAGGLYSEPERRTELAFPPAESIRKTRTAAPRAKRPVKKTAASEGPARFCDRCWRRLDPSGVCKTCPSV